MKKGIGFILSLCMVLLILSPTILVSAADTVASGYCGGEGDGTNLTWVLDSDGLLSISGSGTMENWNPIFGENPPWSNSKSSVRSLLIGQGVTAIGMGAFSGCGNLASVSLSGGITFIGAYAFSGCNHLTGVTLPDSLTTIDANAFFGCASLTEIELPENLEVIGRSAFYHSGLGTVRIPANVSNIHPGAFAYCDDLTSFTVEAGNDCYVVADGVLYTKDMSGLVNYPAGKAAAGFSVPEGVTNIGYQAFQGAERLTDIALPEGLLVIDTQAFYSCRSLVSVTMPSEIDRIGTYAFSNCTSLTSISLPLGLTNTGEYVFYGDTALASVSIGADVVTIGAAAFADTGLTSLTIPDGVTAINNQAFYGCDSLTTVSVGSGVSSISTRAFASCPQLVTVRFAGDAPSVAAAGSTGSFDTTATLSYLESSAGWTTPAWQGYTTGIWTMEDPEFTVCFDANGGGVKPASQIKSHGTGLVLNTVVPAREHYRFLGWAVTADAVSAAYQPGDTYNAEGAATLYAV